MVDRKGAVYAENKIKFSWLIGLGVDCDEIHLGQLCD